MRDCNGCKYHMPNNECCIGTIEKCPLEISYEALKMLRHIFDARIDNAQDDSAYIAWTSARDIVEYALADNLECLSQFDYLPTKEDEEVSINIIKGLKEVCEQFGATLGCSEEFLESHHLT